MPGRGGGGGGVPSAPVQEAQRLCPGMSGGAEGRRRDYLPDPGMEEKLGWTEPGGSTKGLRKLHLQPSPESGAGDRRGPVGSTWVDPKLGAVGKGRGSPSAALPTPADERGHIDPDCHPPVEGLAPGARGEGQAAVLGGWRWGAGRGERFATEVWPRGRGREAPQGFGPAAAAAPPSSGLSCGAAARCLPAALQSQSALTCPRIKSKKAKRVH